MVFKNTYFQSDQKKKGYIYKYYTNNINIKKTNITTITKKFDVKANNFLKNVNINIKKIRIKLNMCIKKLIQT